MKTSPRYPLALAGVLCWLMLVLFLYYWIHKPITTHLMEATGGALLDYGAAFLFLMVGGAAGRTLVRRFFPDDWQSLSTAEQLSGEGFIGLAILSVLIFLVGLVNLSVFSMLALLAATILFLRGRVFTWAGAWISWLRGAKFDFLWGKGLALFIGFNLAMACLMALLPPTKFDSLTYHLVGPKLWVQEGKFTALPNNHFFGFPQYVNTLYTGHIALLAGRLTGTATVHALFGILTLMAVGGYGARRFNKFVGWAAVAVLLSATSIWLEISWAYVDMVGLGTAMLTFAALERWKETQKPAFLILGGIFAGLALSSKYNAAMVGFAGTLYLFLYGWRHGITALIKSAAIFGIAALVVVSPWLIRNLFFYDNPVYPLGPTTGEWDDLSNHFYFYMRDDTSVLEKRWWMVALLPFTPTFLGVEGGEPFSATIGPLFALLIPLLLLTWKSLQPDWRSSVRDLLWFLLFLHVFWLYSMTNRWTETRLVLSIFPLMAILAAVALDSLRLLPEKPLNIAWMIRTVVALILFLTAVNHVAGVRPKEGDENFQGTTMVSHFLETRAFDYLLGIVNKREFLEDALGWYMPAMDAVNALPEGSHVLFLWETRSLYCEDGKITCEEDTIIMRWWHDRRAIGSAEDIVESWKKHGVTHLLVWETGREFEFENNPVGLFEPNDFEEWNKVPALLEIIWQGEDIYTLYKLP
ncbi:MAG: glycosyltransferase family 39 protein [Anaerolineae bacterium]|nr:glycosyltransferase family 39 protein [Anaerolineae bacterium]